MTHETKVDPKYPLDGCVGQLAGPNGTGCMGVVTRALRWLVVLLRG